MRRVLLPLLAVALLGTSGCVAAVVGAAGAGAGLGYAQAKKSNTAAKQDAAAPSAKGKSHPESLKPLPAPGQFVECQLKEGEKLAMSAADCKAKGGAPS
jgi:hypothetical protein